MTNSVPRGTVGSRYPAVAQDWPTLLRAHEAEQSGGEPQEGVGTRGHANALSYAQERRRVHAAGFAHIARLAVDGGPVVEPKPIRRRLTLQMVGLIGIGVCALGAVAVVFGVMG